VGLRGVAACGGHSATPLSYNSRTSWSDNVQKPSVYTLHKRLFLNPASTGYTSFILAEVESSDGGAYKYGNYLLTIADCKRVIKLEFFLGTKQARSIALRKINLLIDVLTRFRDALANKIALIEKGESSGPQKTKKA
jgi:hypothetical protein